MSKQAKIVWQEGMALHPQHFQQQERHFQYLIKQANRRYPAHYYGFHDYQLAKPLFSLLRLHLETASGIFPDGTPFDLGGSNPTAALEPVTVPIDTTDQLVYLCLPLTEANQAEAGSISAHRYRSEVANLCDINQPQGREVPLIVGKLNLQLRLAQDNLSAFTVLPIAKIKYCDEQQGIILDETYIPPVLNYGAAPQLQQGLEEITGLLTQRVKTLALQVSSPSYQRMTDINEWLILHTLNRHLLTWQYAVIHHQRHPTDLYLLTLQLLGELATFATSEKYWPGLVQYQQADLATTFLPLFKALRLQLNKVIETSAFTVPLEKTEQGWWQSPVLNADLITNNQFILAVKAQLAQEELQKIFPGQAKLAAADQIAIFVRSQLPGLSLGLLATVPPAVPYYAGFTYFAIEQHPALWTNLVECGQLAIHVAGQLPGLELHCWAVRT